MLCPVWLKTFHEEDKLTIVGNPCTMLSPSPHSLLHGVAFCVPAEEGPDPKLTEVSPFPLELVRHEVPVQAAADGCGLAL